MQLEIPAAPTLTFGEPEPAAAAATAVLKPRPVKEELNLSPQELQIVDTFAKQIDLTNTQAVMNYGAGTQKKMADFSEKAIGSVRTKDMGEVGDMLSGLVTELKSFDVSDDAKGIGAFFKKKANKITGSNQETWLEI